MTTTSPPQSQSQSSSSFYKLNLGTLPDDLYFDEVPVEKWLALAEQSPSVDGAAAGTAAGTTAAAGCVGFPPNSLNQLVPLEPMVEIERIIGISMYMLGNVLPFALPPLIVGAFYSVVARYALFALLFYAGSFMTVHAVFFQPYFLKRYKRTANMNHNNVRDNQYLYTERNSCKYLNTTVVWPSSLHEGGKYKDKPVIFCMVPHGVAPFGATAYPMWSKLWSSKLCHWTCAPIILQLPFIGYFMNQIGYIPAKSQPIIETLTGTEKQESVGVFLDGIHGMFQPQNGIAGKEETAYLKQRKGIVKIALRAGVPIIPVYGFGHTAMYTVLVDPFGILEWLSIQLQASLTPFYGRWGWFLGPPRRIPVTLCLGEPIECPLIAEPTKDDVNRYHAEMVAGFQQVFQEHKHAYGWGDKTLKVV